MKILLARESNGHPFWQRKKYYFTLLDTEAQTAEDIDNSLYRMFNGRIRGWDEVEYTFTDKGVVAQLFHCSSGAGKTKWGEPFLAIPASDYDKHIILPSEEKRRAEARYEGNWQDNSDFE